MAEFVDYRCSTCRITQPSLVRLLQEDRSIRFIVMEWPILSACCSARSDAGGTVTLPEADRTLSDKQPA